MEQLKSDEFIDKDGLTATVDEIWVGRKLSGWHEEHRAVALSDPDAIPAARAFLLAAEEAHKAPWVEIDSHRRIRRDGTDATVEGETYFTGMTCYDSCSEMEEKWEQAFRRGLEIGGGG